jgi:hypothetical protein
MKKVKKSADKVRSASNSGGAEQQLRTIETAQRDLQIEINE